MLFTSTTEILLRISVKDGRMLIVQTPLRISFAGGGTDFPDFYSKYGGAVLSTAINKYVFVIVKKRFDDDVCVNYSQREMVDDIDKIRHELIRECLKKVGISKAVEITTLADISSEGTGLGSSSSITVSLLQALYTYKGIYKTADALAEEACHIEMDILRKPIGKQDQYIAAHGNMRFINFDNEKVTTEKVFISSMNRRRLENSLVLFYTGRSRSSSDILTEQKSNIGNSTDTLLELKGFAFKAKEAIARCKFDELGEILDQSWNLKKKLASRISNPDIDEIYQTGIKAGAIGGKICGAGAGGFILFYCPPGKQDNLREKVKLKELPIRFERDGSKVIFDYKSAY
jgi:D-glycero-alpha-D-manno-heptose-7-phosphate kinase